MKLMGALALLVLLVAISFEHVHAEATCETGWLPLPNTTDICYKKFEGLNLTYYGAEDHCAGLDAELPGPKYKNPIDYIDFDTRIWIYTPGIRNNNCKTLNIESDVNNNRAIMMRDCYNTYNFICIKLGEGVDPPIILVGHGCDDPVWITYDGGVITTSVIGEYLLSWYGNPFSPCFFKVTVTLVSDDDPILPQVYISYICIFMERVTLFFYQDSLYLVEGDITMTYADYYEGDRFFDWGQDRIYWDNGCVIFECDGCIFSLMWCPNWEKTCIWLKLGRDYYFDVGMAGLFGNADGNLTNDFMIGNENVHGQPDQNIRMREQYRITS